ncbi:uncharacterized protein Syt12 [Drosophila bipectinata]|uniref:uncharacterized protein Syt12 n=1 Tax=Drosophila bipectinata TaxID=42026 RepID=UPI001C89CDE9|nr:uncharacterized protein LOC108120132 [Drosophila bipectinata]
MEGTPLAMMSFASLALLLLAVLVMGILFACHCLGPRAASWMRMRSSKEEKIGLSNHKHKLFHANGYMASIQSGSEFLLSTSGSFKRFDTIDKDDHNRSQQLLLMNGCLVGGSGGTNNTLEVTTPLWNLPQADVSIPPQPLRPAPAPNSAGPATKTVTFSFSQDQEPADPEHRSSCLRQNGSISNGVLPQPLEAPPPPRLTTSASVNLSATAIPRPIAKRLVGQALNGMPQDPQPEVEHQPEILPETERRIPALKRRNSSTNPFLCESTEQMPPGLPAADPPVATISAPAGTSSVSTATASVSLPSQSLPVQAASSESSNHHNGNPFVDTNSLSSRLLKLQNTTNPFTGLSQRVKGPHLLQKTISEDYLFRKLGMNGGSMANGNGSGHVNGNGNGTWSFGRSLLRQDSTLSLGMGLGRRNSSQVSLDSGSGSVAGSMEGINLERAVSCDSVTSESNLILEQLDQPYTQITGYLCVGLHYDKNCISTEGMELTVSVLEAKGLICPFSVDSLDTFVRIYLVPDHPGAMQTKVVRATGTPNYNESFNFWLQKRQARHSLWFHLYHNGPAHTLIGEAEMEIGETPKPITTWIPLSDSRKCNARWGELMFSLSYLPTAERLTIVVVKARNLKLDPDPEDMPAKKKDQLKQQHQQESKEQDPMDTVQSVFVKVYLMDNERKVLKKRTSLKRKDRGPIFNESVIFNVPPPSLTTARLRLTVFGVTGGGGLLPLGHVVAGSCAVGKGLRHWHQMLSSLRKPVAMWHVLRRAINQPVFAGGAEAVVAAMQSTLQRTSVKRNSIV